MSELIPVTLIEIDTQFCSLTYGEGACQAALGVTGADKCYNTRNRDCDCQDPDNFDPITKTVRLGVENGHLPDDIDCIPVIARDTDVRVRNAIVKPGISIGERSTINVTAMNMLHSDEGLDPYFAERSYDPYRSGTFWGKFLARNPYLDKNNMRLIRGWVGQDLQDMEVWHFIIDRISGPDERGRVSVKGVDFMRLLDAESALAPAPSPGYLSTGYTAGTSSITLAPSGIGSEYPSTGEVAIGEHIYQFTKTGDDLALTPNLVEDQEADDVAQLVLSFDGETADDILETLVVDYSPLTSSNVPSSDWEQTINSFSDTLYTTKIAKPTPTKKLINELVELAGLIMHGNTKTQLIDLDVLRPIVATEATISEDQMIEDSFDKAYQYDKRFTIIVVNFNQINRLKNLNEPGNFAGTVVSPVSENLFSTVKTKQIPSRWIPINGRTIAEAVASRARARYKFPPLMFTFSLFAGQEQYQIGQYLTIEHTAVEGCSGGVKATNAIITGVESANDAFAYQAEEITFDAGEVGGTRVIKIDADQNNIVFRDIYDSVHATVESSTVVEFIIGNGVIIGSEFSDQFSATMGDWPAGTTIKITNNGFIVGPGGAGGLEGTGGQDGGDALEVTRAVEIDNTAGIIGGGGGGGGSVEYTPAVGTTLLGRGGGGAGRLGGLGGGYYYISGSGGEPPATRAELQTGQEGTEFTGVVYAGDGGDLGQPGTAGNGSNPTSGGAAGVAVDGDSFVTWVSGSIANVYGARIN